MGSVNNLTPQTVAGEVDGEEQELQLEAALRTTSPSDAIEPELG